MLTKERFQTLMKCLLEASLKMFIIHMNTKKMIRMSNKNKILWIVLALLNLLTSCVVWGSEDDILTFYTKRAAEVFQSRNPIESGTAFSFTAKTYYKILNDQSRYILTDSSEATYYYSFGQEDSINFIIAPEHEFESLPLVYPDIFSGNYLYNFFPNDTGSIDLPIGFDTPKMDTTLPVGFIVIDRQKYIYRYLYLYYLNPTRFKRWSLGYRFIEYEGMIFPDSIWTLKSRRQLFFADNYRYETKLFDFTIYR